jgi:Na+-transporting NADH:ubiquinone oxidoreductase subunit C
MRVYQVVKNTRVQMVILPVEGRGLWSTLHGYLALDTDGNTVVGITFYQHSETPGLGGEVDNPKWKERWRGRKLFDEHGQLRIAVAKGAAGPPESDPHRVDGLSGSTLTSRGVTNMLSFWMGENGFGPYLERLQREGAEL